MAEASGARRDRGHLGPVALAGVATAALATLVSTRPWFSGGADLEQAAMPGVSAPGAETSYPAATGVALVLLAAWGVLLVTRGRVRRAFAVIAAVSAVGLLATVVTAGVSPPQSTRVLPGDAVPPDPSLTTWFWVGAVLALTALVPAVLAVRWSPRWPEMGSRYDAPADASAATAARTQGGATAGGAAEPASERDLWRSMDEGRDPTDPPSVPQRPLD